MPIFWTPLAYADLERIHAYIAQESPKNAGVVVRTIYSTVRVQLTTAPLSGREGRIEHTREVVIPHLPYIVVYRIYKGEVQILRILHTSLRWPEKM